MTAQAHHEIVKTAQMVAASTLEVIDSKVTHRHRNGKVTSFWETPGLKN